MLGASLCSGHVYLACTYAEWHTDWAACHQALVSFTNQLESVEPIRTSDMYAETGSSNQSLKSKQPTPCTANFRIPSDSHSNVTFYCSFTPTLSSCPAWSVWVDVPRNAHVPRGWHGTGNTQVYLWMAWSLVILHSLQKALEAEARHGPSASAEGSLLPPPNQLGTTTFR